MTGPLLQVSDLTVRYRGAVRAAVSGVSLDVLPGETVGLVGESGSGKSSVGRAVLGLVRPSSGQICLAGQDIAAGQRAAERGRTVQAIFQDPYSSLNPTRTIGSSLAEPLRVRGAGRPVGRAGSRQLVAAMLERVGLPVAAMDRYPAQFSGGQRQRVAIARALVSAPRLVVCDEPVSALDLSIQAQVLNLLAELQAELGLAYLFISHDLAVVRHLAHRIVVLRQGEVVESGPAERVYAQPQHPYTRALLAAAPIPDPAVQHGRSLLVTRGVAGSG